jgi:hypothetical protein
MLYPYFPFLTFGGFEFYSAVCGLKGGRPGAYRGIGIRFLIDRRKEKVGLADRIENIGLPPLV